VRNGARSDIPREFDMDLMQRFAAADLLDLSAESIIIRDAEGCALVWNAASAALYGWQREEVLGANVDALLASRPRLKLDRIPPERWTSDVTRVASDQRLVLVEATYTPHFASDGSLAFVVETARDVTEARASQQALRSNEQRYRTLFQAVTAACMEVDLSRALERLAPLLAAAQGEPRAHLLAHPALVQDLLDHVRIVEMNDRSVEILGARGTPFPDTLRPFWTMESNDVFVDMLLARGRDERRLIREVQLRRLSGERLFGVFTMCLDAGRIGEGRVMIGIVDTTEIRTANARIEEGREKFKALFEQMPIGLCVINCDALDSFYVQAGLNDQTDLEAYFAQRPEVAEAIQRMVYIEEANAHAVKLLALDDPAEIIGQTVDFAWAKRPDTFIRTIIAGIHRNSMEEQTQIVDRKGQVHDVIFTCVSIRQGGHRRAVISMLDIGDRLAAQAALDGLRAEFAHAARISLLGELSASIAHEISQPLTAIATSSQTGRQSLAKPEPDLEAAATALERVSSYALRAREIITRVRGMASGRAPVLGETRLADLVTGAMPLVEAQARAMRIEISVCDRSAARQIVVDRTQIEQVIVNILVNAMQVIDSHAPAERRVAIEIFDRGEMVGCAIADSGPGLPADRLESVFQRFVSTKPDGMGLGLALCRSIIDAHDGTITADNASPLGGARFAFELPVSTEAAAF